MTEKKKLGGIYAIKDEHLRFEMIYLSSNGEPCESLDKFKTIVFNHTHHSQAVVTSKGRYVACLMPTEWDFDLEEYEGYASPLDAAKASIDLILEGWTVFVWDRYNRRIHRLESNEYIYSGLKELIDSDGVSESAEQSVAQCRMVPAALSEAAPVHLRSNFQGDSGISINDLADNYNFKTEPAEAEVKNADDENFKVSPTLETHKPLNALRDDLIEALRDDLIEALSEAEDDKVEVELTLLGGQHRNGSMVFISGFPHVDVKSGSVTLHRRSENNKLTMEQSMVYPVARIVGDLPCVVGFRRIGDSR